jgi:hypothetical protein
MNFVEIELGRRLQSARMPFLVFGYRVVARVALWVAELPA